MYTYDVHMNAKIRLPVNTEISFFKLACMQHLISETTRAD